MRLEIYFFILQRRAFHLIKKTDFNLGDLLRIKPVESTAATLADIVEMTPDTREAREHI